MMGLRIRIASHFGKLEHISARLLGFMLIFILVALYFDDYRYVRYFAMISFGLWSVYIVSHTLEKASYPNNFR